MPVSTLEAARPKVTTHALNTSEGSDIENCFMHAVPCTQLKRGGSRL